MLFHLEVKTSHQRKAAIAPAILMKAAIESRNAQASLILGSCMLPPGALPAL